MNNDEWWKNFHDQMGWFNTPALQKKAADNMIEYLDGTLNFWTTDIKWIASNAQKWNVNSKMRFRGFNGAMAMWYVFANLVKQQGGVNSIAAGNLKWPDALSEYLVKLFPKASNKDLWAPKTDFYKATSDTETWEEFNYSTVRYPTTAEYYNGSRSEAQDFWIYVFFALCFAGDSSTDDWIEDKLKYPEMHKDDNNPIDVFKKEGSYSSTKWWYEKCMPHTTAYSGGEKINVGDNAWAAFAKSVEAYGATGLNTSFWESGFGNQNFVVLNMGQTLFVNTMVLLGTTNELYKDREIGGDSLLPGIIELFWRFKLKDNAPQQTLTYWDQQLVRLIYGTHSDQPKMNYSADGLGKMPHKPGTAETPFLITEDLMIKRSFYYLSSGTAMGNQAFKDYKDTAEAADIQAPVAATTPTGKHLTDKLTEFLKGTPSLELFAGCVTYGLQAIDQEGQNSFKDEHIVDVDKWLAADPRFMAPAMATGILYVLPTDKNTITFIADRLAGVTNQNQFATYNQKLPKSQQIYLQEGLYQSGDGPDLHMMERDDWGTLLVDSGGWMAADTNAFFINQVPMPSSFDEFTENYHKRNGRDPKNHFSGVPFFGHPGSKNKAIKNLIDTFRGHMPTKVLDFTYPNKEGSPAYQLSNAYKMGNRFNHSYYGGSPNDGKSYLYAYRALYDFAWTSGSSPTLFDFAKSGKDSKINSWLGNPWSPEPPGGWQLYPADGDPSSQAFPYYKTPPAGLGGWMRAKTHREPIDVQLVAAGKHKHTIIPKKYLTAAKALGIPVAEADPYTRFTDHSENMSVADPLKTPPSLQALVKKNTADPSDGETVIDLPGANYTDRKANRPTVSQIELRKRMDIIIEKNIALSSLDLDFGRLDKVPISPSALYCFEMIGEIMQNTWDAFSKVVNRGFPVDPWGFAQTDAANMWSTWVSWTSLKIAHWMHKAIYDQISYYKFEALKQQSEKEKDISTLVAWAKKYKDATAKIARDALRESVQDHIANRPKPKKLLTEPDHNLQAKLKQRQKFIDQCVLLTNMQSLKKRYEDKVIERAKVPNDPIHSKAGGGLAPWGNRFYLLEHSKREHHKIPNYLSANSAGVIRDFLDITPDIASALVPQMRFFKVYGDEEEVEFTFENITNEQRVKDLGDLTKPQKDIDRGSGVGIKSFNVTYEGGTPASADKDLKAELTLYFQNFHDLYKSRGDFAYIDLLLYPGAIETDPKLRKSLTNHRIHPRHYDPKDYRIRAEIGWMQRTDQEFKNLLSERAIHINSFNAALAQTNKSLYLNMIDHDIDIKNDGTVEIRITYGAFLESASRSPKFDALASPEVVLFREKKRKDVEEALKVCEPHEFNKLLISREFYENKIRKSLYQSIFNRLTKRKAIYNVNMDAKQLAQYEKGGRIPRIEDKPLTTKVSPKVSLQYKNIKFFFMGDLIHTLLDTIFKPSKKMKQEIEDDKDLSKVTDKLGEVEDEFNRTVFLLSEFSYDTFAERGSNKNFFDINIAEIPISTTYFREWLTENVIKPDKKAYPLMLFIKDLLNMLVDLLTEACLNASVDKSVHFQTIQMMGAGIYNSKNDVIDQITKIRSEKKKVYKLPVNEVHTSYDTNADGVSDFNKEIALPIKHWKDGAEISDYYNYMLIYPVSSIGISAHKGRGVKKDDENQGIYHLDIGQDRGIVKNVKFKKSDMQYIREARFFNQGADGLLQLGAVYVADIEMIGNTLFVPGMEVWLDPKGIGGLSWDPRKKASEGSVANALGIGGYHVVTRVKLNFLPNKFSTTVTAMFHYAGDGENRAILSKGASPWNLQRASKGNPNANSAQCSALIAQTKPKSKANIANDSPPTKKKRRKKKRKRKSRRSQ